jgi:hypothetical protein
MEPNLPLLMTRSMEADFNFTTVGTALLVLGLAYLLSGLVFLLPNLRDPSDNSTPHGEP